MANCIIMGGGGGGTLSSDVTATRANVLAGTRTVTSDSNNEVVEGTMVNRGTVNQSIGINGSYTIPQGYHSGSGKVSQSVTTKGAATYYPTTSDQIISANQWLNGAQTIKGISQQNLIANNIKKGVTVYVKNGNGNIYAVTGTFEGYVPTANNLYYYGQNTASLAYYGTTHKTVRFNSGEITFTGGTSVSNAVGYCLGSKSYQVNADRFTKCTIAGNMFFNANAVADRYGVDIYFDLMDSGADYTSTSTYKYRLGTYTYTNTSYSVTLSNIVIPLTPRGATGYFRIWFQGFYIRSGETYHRTEYGYSLGTGTTPASIRSIILS